MEREECLELLKNWCDGLLRYQIHDRKDARFDGGFFCPACKMIHGRCQDAVYPLLCAADLTGEKKYQDAAEAVFNWGFNMVCDDGSFYNDAQSAWNGITVFAVISLCEALNYHGHLLDLETKKQWERRMKTGAEWIAKTISPEFRNNINYHASAAAALALVGNYTKREDFFVKAKRLADYCETHFLENGLLYGEGQPSEHVTKRGCRPIDIGYNAEETLPSLLLYAKTVCNDRLIEKIKGILKKQLLFMLPDGGWDNSFGTRNYKWTYWGSRTSDGCQAAYGVWGEEEPLFHEAAVRNLNLYRKCSKDGLLYGGPHYAEHGEEPCIHHTFCHVKVLASMLDSGVWSKERVKLPSEYADPVCYFPEIDTWKIAKGDYLGTVTGYDFDYMKGGHASGGTLTMLWHQASGPVIMSSMTDYWLKEPHNMQLSLKKSQHRSLTPRIEAHWEGKTYGSCYDYDAVIQAEEKENEIWIRSEMELKDEQHHSADVPILASLEYGFTDSGVVIKGAVSARKSFSECSDPVFVLPIIGRHSQPLFSKQNGWRIVREKAVIDVMSLKKEALERPEPIFFLSGGFEAWEFKIQPDEYGTFQIVIHIEETER